MADVKISKKEYTMLKRQAEAFRLFASRVFQVTIAPVRDVVADFRKTNLYSDDFLNDLESGLSKSSYAKVYADSSNQKRSAKVSHRSY